MQIAKPCVVTLTWSLRSAQDEPIDDLTEPTEFYFGGDDLLPRIEEVLDGQSPGFQTTVQLEPEHAFGEYDASLVYFESRARLPAGVDVGMRFDGPPPGTATEGLREDAIYTVTEVYPEHVVLDGNHPLAGIALRIALVVHSVRFPTEQEVAAGTVGEPLLAVAPNLPPGSTVH